MYALSCNKAVLTGEVSQWPTVLNGICHVYNHDGRLVHTGDVSLQSERMFKVIAISFGPAVCIMCI